MNSIMPTTSRQWVFTHPDRPLADWANELGLHPSETASAHGWDGVIADLSSMRDLNNDWDGAGAEAPKSALVDGAIRLARDLKAANWPPADRVTPSVNGTVYFEWHTPLGYQEIELASPHDAESRWVRKDSETATDHGR